jgi:uncharacterized membrane protein
MDQHRDRITDWAAIGLSVLITVSLWAMFVYEWFAVDPVGEVTPWLRWLALLFTLLAVITLFGMEKVAAALGKVGGK